ncbi:MAG: tetratricopeptide repeat protein, partial [Pyrinomonadaceae bacterium]
MRHDRLVSILICTTVLCLNALLATSTSAQNTHPITNQHDLIDALVAAKDETEVRQILDENKSLVTPDLNKSITSAAPSPNTAKEFDEFIRHMKMARIVAAEMKDRKAEATALRILGKAYRDQSEYIQALNYLKEGLPLAEQMGDKQEQVFLLYYRATVGRAMGNYREGLGDAKRAMGLAKEVGDEEQFYWSHYEAGLDSYNLGDYRVALSYLIAAMTYFEQQDNKEGMRDVLNGIAGIYAAQGNYAQALEYCQQILKIGKDEGQNENTTSVISNIGALYSLQGNHKAALEKFQESLKLSEEIGDRRGIGLSLINIGITFFDQGDNAQALVYSSKSLAIAEQIGDKDGESATLINITRVLNRSGKYDQAVDTAERAIVIAKQINQPEILWQAYTNVGEAYVGLKQYDKARLSFTNAIETIESLRNKVAGGEQATQSYLENRIAPYYAMVDLLTGEKKPLEALAYAERAKGRVVLDVLKNGKTGIVKAMTLSEKENEEKLDAEIRRLNSQILAENARAKTNEQRLSDLEEHLRKARLDYESFQTSLYASHPELKVQRGQFAPPTEEQLTELISDPKLAILEYAVTDEKAYLFVLT